MVVERILQKFNTETHKGVAIQVVKKILGSGETKVLGRFALQNKRYEIKGDTKDYVIGIAKQKINAILGK